MATSIEEVSCAAGNRAGKQQCAVGHRFQKPGPKPDLRVERCAIPSARLVLRCDADAASGLGHLMRCLALGDAWRKAGGSVSLLCPDIPAGLVDRVAQIASRPSVLVPPFSDVKATAAIIAEEAPDWVVLDSYRYAADLPEALRNQGMRVLIIDDVGHLPRYPCDLLLNQNLHAGPDLYAGKLERDALLGPAFVLFRSELAAAAGSERDYPPTLRDILFLAGGSDPANAAGLYLKAIDRLRPAIPHAVTMTIIVGASNPRRDWLTEQAARRPGVRVLANVEDMSVPYRAADLAVTAGGTTVWELALFKMPLLICAHNEYEEISARAVEVHRAGLFLGQFSELSADTVATHIWSLANNQNLRSSLGIAAGKLCDGKGTDRLLAAMKAVEQSRNRQ